MVQGAWLLLELVEDLGVFHMMLGLQANYKYKSYGVAEASTRFLRKAWEVRQCVAVSGFLQVAPERALCESVRVKSNGNPGCWRYQKQGFSVKAM